MAGNPYFMYLDEFNKGAFTPCSSKNRLCISRLKNIYTPISAGNFAIKYVLSGAECYTINNTRFEVKENHFLTTCTQATGFGAIESKSIVDGVCIDIDYNTIAEAYTILSLKDAVDLDNNLCQYFLSPEFFDRVYPTRFYSLGQLLRQITGMLKDPKQHPDENELNEESFFDLAEMVVIHENQNWKGLNALSSLKTATKKEILSRLLKAKEFMEENFRAPLKIGEIARVGLMSQFHFYRSFKEVFRISPYQFLLQKKLTTAYAQLTSSESSVGEVAEENGFSDICSFSKAFRKYYGVPPSKVAKAASIPPAENANHTCPKPW